MLTLSIACASQEQRSCSVLAASGGLKSLHCTACIQYRIGIATILLCTHRFSQLNTFQRQLSIMKLSRVWTQKPHWVMSFLRSWVHSLKNSTTNMHDEERDGLPSVDSCRWIVFSCIKTYNSTPFTFSGVLLQQSFSQDTENQI